MRIRPIAGLLSAVVLLVCILSAAPTAAAETVPMTWKPYDKAYVTIVFDDNKADLGEVYDIVYGEYGFPLCAAVPTATLPRNLELLHEIEDNGGEILAHGHNHTVLNNNVPWTTVLNEFANSYNTLAEAGFNVHGTITCGGGGTEDTSEDYRRKIEPVMSRYFDYSNNWGVSTQYYHDREWMYGRGPSVIQTLIDTAIDGKEWLVLFAHSLEEVPLKLLRSVLDYLKEQQQAGKLEVVTYRDLHKRFAVWETPVDLDTMPILATTTTTTTTTTTATTADTATSTSRLQHSTPTYLTTTTTAVTGTPDVSEPQAPDSSAPADAPAADTDTDRPTGEKDPAPWIPWAIGGAAVVVCTAGAITAALIWRKKRTPPTE